MQYEDRQAYDQAIKNFHLEQKQKFEWKDFYDQTENQDLVLRELKDFDWITNSYLADNTLKASDTYYSFPLINAFNIVQQNMRNLKQIFEQREDGLYGVWLWKQGFQYLVIVDDWIPCKQIGNYPQLVTITSKYEWPIILEKAIGKILGFRYNSFNIIKNDSIDFYLQMITGSIIQEQEFQSFDDLLKKQKDQSNILFVKYQRGNQIIASVISIGQKKIDNQEQIVIKLMAPNKQSNFQQDLQQDNSQCDLTWQEFRQKFRTVYVLIWKDEYRVTTVSLNKIIERKTDIVENTYFHKVNIDETNNYQLILWQNEVLQENGLLLVRDQREKQYFGFIRILLFQEMKANQYKFIDGNCNFSQYIYLNTLLEKGEYYILCQGYFNNIQNQSNEQFQQYCSLNLTIKGGKVPLTINPDNHYEQLKIYLIQSLVKHTLQKENTRSIKQPQIQVTTNQIYGFLYFYYENKGTIDINEQLSFQELGYLLRYDTLHKQQQVLVRVGQNQFKILLYTLDPKIIVNTDNIGFQYEYTHKLLDENQIKIDEQQRFLEIVNDKNTKKFECEQIYTYLHQHNKGMIIQFENNSEQNAQFELQFNYLENLTLINNEEYNVNQNSIKFSLQKQSKQQMLFDVIQSNKEYKHKINFEISKIY